jgi:tetratricopeptide (TPR) repeat protein
MKTFTNDEPRRLAPRWRSLFKTEKAGQLSALRASPRKQENHEALVLHKLALWREQRTVALAADVVSAALVVGQHAVAAEAAEFLLRSGARDPDAPLFRIAAQVAGTSSPDDPATATPRALLFLEARNALAWSELARLQISSGATKRAKRSMQVALAMAPNNRFVLRSASRLAIHLTDPKHAAHLVRIADASRYDPWLVAAEVAACNIAGITSPLIRIGRQMIRGDFSPHDLSELAASLAQLEMANGNVRRARKLFLKALERPTDNTVAQLEWDARMEPKIEELTHDIDVGGQLFAEARAIEAFRERRWESAKEACALWLDDEPFSTRPAIFGTVVGAVCLADFDIGILFAQRGLRANPHNFTLLNNLAFSLASVNRVEEAAFYHQKLAHLDGSAVPALATGGLIRFRTGDLAGGRVLYEQAVKAAEHERNRLLKAMALAYYAREENLVGSGLGGELLKAAKNEAEKLRGDEAVFFEVTIQKIV